MTGHVPESVRDKGLKKHVTQLYMLGKLPFNYEQLKIEIDTLVRIDGKARVLRLQRILKDKFGNSPSSNTLYKWIGVDRKEKAEKSE